MLYEFRLRNIYLNVWFYIDIHVYVDIIYLYMSQDPLTPNVNIFIFTKSQPSVLIINQQVKHLMQIRDHLVHIKIHNKF